jgi:hypothetical protein
MAIDAIRGSMPRGGESCGIDVEGNRRATMLSRQALVAVTREAIAVRLRRGADRQTEEKPEPEYPNK